LGLPRLSITTPRETLMDIIDDRLTSPSTIYPPIPSPHGKSEIIGGGTLADAVLDRVVHSSHRIDLKGESMRKGSF